MQEINLLKNQLRDTTVVWHRRNKALTSIFVLVLILELGLAGVLFALERLSSNKKTQVLDENRKIQASINSKQDSLVPAKAFQAQLQNLKSLVNSHLYWTKFFDELEAHTFTRSRLKSVHVDSGGIIHLEGEVDNYTNLGKLILGLSTSQKFQDIKLLSSNPSKSEVAAIVFAIDLKLKPELLLEQ